MHTIRCTHTTQVKVLVAKAYATTKETLTKYRGMLDVLTEKLIEQESPPPTLALKP